jgi:hypothetical protein
MKTKLLLSVLMSATFAASGIAAAAPQPISFLGAAAPQNAAVDQVIVITQATRHVNVIGGSTVRFVVGDQSFTWTFQNGNVHVAPFDLARVAPAGLLKQAVTTYVSDNPMYVGS